MPKQKFYFLGKAPFSKSLLNRALIVKSWFPDFKILGDSECEDILIMKTLVQNLKQKKKEFYCGLSGTAFRFLITRLSRENGEFLIKTDSSLLQRPLKEACSFLAQMSVSIKQIDKTFVLSSKGWKLQSDCIYVPGKISSQYASALLLNSWNLDKDLYFVFPSSSVSYPYFTMTLKWLQNLGFQTYQNGEEFVIPKQQSLKKKEGLLEQDKSCLFALACFAVFNGKSVFLDWESSSLQADHIFPEILKQMQVPITCTNSQLTVNQTHCLKAIDISLKGSPDLFPLLAILCAKAEGLSYLRGISHVAFKESNRLNKIQELLHKCQVSCKQEGDTFWIEGKKQWSTNQEAFEFDPAQDHRLLMAAELVKSLNIPIHIKNKQCVKKSFPDFYSFINA